jgi:uncharacterized protein (TIGR00730 family)
VEHGVHYTAAVRSICVFCGSSPGRDPRYAEAAAALGALVAQAGLTLVYGGARVGLMGTVANAALAAGGHVIGVLPAVLGEREVEHDGLSELHRVGTMHERKALMAELAGGFVALPGGLGTMEELFEVATWSYLEIHAKPFGLLNTAGYYDPLLAFLDRAVSDGFIRAETRARFLVESEPAALLDRLRAA